MTRLVIPTYSIMTPTHVPQCYLVSLINNYYWLRFKGVHYIHNGYCDSSEWPTSSNRHGKVKIHILDWGKGEIYGGATSI